ncbi:MAG: response regulator transcription factor, partial [gamma proteobacterium symbiont of Ctena orbiculata]
MSYKEIAVMRDVSEKTVRQQAHAIYRKAKLSGRAALSAFFLEDLLLPPNSNNSRER